MLGSGKLKFLFGCFLIWHMGLSYAQNTRLKSLLVEVNHEPRLLSGGDALQLVWGDSLKLIDAEIEPVGNKVLGINFVGFANHDSLSAEDDRGFLIRTHHDLLKSWSRDGKGRYYQIKVILLNGSELSLDVVLQLPELKYVVLDINGKKSTIQKGEVLKIASEDTFKIIRVETNMGTNPKQVKLDVRQEPIPNRQNSAMLYQLRFFRYNQLFGSISLEAGAVQKPEFLFR